MAAGGATQCPEIPRRCHHCAGPLSKDMETSSWTVSPLVRDSFSMIGSAVGGTASAFYGFNHVMPVVRRYIKGPMWIHFLVGAPPVIVFSSACAGLAAGLSDLARRLSANRGVTAGTDSQFVLAVLMGRTGGTVPAVAQLVKSSYHAAMSSPSFGHSASSTTMPSPSFGHSASRDDIHKTRSSSPL